MDHFSSVIQIENKQKHATVEVRNVETRQSKKGMCLSMCFNIRRDNCADSEGDPHQSLWLSYQRRIEQSNNLIIYVRNFATVGSPNVQTVTHLKT